jgi:MinD superfamily P-loop ATPase
MIIAVASGKGGTGKTTIAVSLALTASQLPGAAGCNQAGVLYLDCDVEAPNAHLFLNPTFQQTREVGIFIPEIDATRCTYCGRCAEVCQYHAIAVLGKKTLVFPQLCHGCGSCTRACPEGAIREIPDRIGVLERGPTPLGIDFGRGMLDIGEPMAVPIIRQLKAWAKPTPDQLVIRDAPPGTSCPVVETARGADYLLLVTEPTPFGLHDLKLAVGVARELGVPMGVVINRAGLGDQRVEEYCAQEELPILLRIPFERKIAEAIARGSVLVRALPEYQPGFTQLLHSILASVAKEAYP